MLSFPRKKREKHFVENEKNIEALHLFDVFYNLITVLLGSYYWGCWLYLSHFGERKKSQKVHELPNIASSLNVLFNTQ